MKKTLVMLALSTVGFAPVFAAAPATTPAPEKETQQPATTQITPAKPVEIKKIVSQADDKTTPTTTPATPTTKPKMVLIVDEKPCGCPTDKKDCSVEKKDGQKTPAQTPAKATPAKIALA